MSRPAIFSRKNGNARPAKFEPPPTHPTTTSGNAPASSICAIASCPITVWCRRTWLRTLPSEYAVSSRPAASSTASEIAMPRLPGESACSSSTARPDCVSGDGLGTTSAPHDWMSDRRNGFWSYETRTMYTLHSSPKSLHANASALPHWPAPVSVARRVRPSRLL
jgi:hypothetical protein